MLCHACGEVPDPYVSIAATRHKGTLVRNHSPHTHDMALQTPQMSTFCIKNVDLGVIKRNDDIVGREVQGGHYSLIRCDLSRLHITTMSPSSLHLVSLLEVAPIAERFRPSSML